MKKYNLYSYWQRPFGLGYISLSMGVLDVFSSRKEFSSQRNFNGMKENPTTPSAGILKKIILYLIVILTLIGCNIESYIDEQAFGDFTLQEMIDVAYELNVIQRDVTHEKALEYLDSLSRTNKRKSESFHYFIDIHTKYNEIDRNVQLEDIETTDYYQNLIAHKNFSKQHPLNKSLLHFHAYIVNANVKERKNHLEQSIDILKTLSADYTKILCILYSTFYHQTVWDWDEVSKSIESIESAIGICNKCNCHDKAGHLYSKKINLLRRNRDLLGALAVYPKKEESMKKYSYVSNDYMWDFFYSDKITFLYELDDIFPNEGYQDSISYYLNMLNEQFENKSISERVYTQTIKNNINSMIKINQFEKAQSHISKLEKLYYAEGVNTNCYNIALLNMNKYVLERNIGTEASYRQALINAYDHMTSCGDVVHDSKYYGVMWSNVLYHLMYIDAQNGNYKDAFEWSKLRYVHVKEKQNKSSDKHKVNQSEFWQEREKKNTEKLIQLQKERNESLSSRMMLIQGIAIGLLGFLSLFLFLFLKIRKQKKRISLDSELLKANNENLLELNKSLDQSKKLIFEQKEKVEAELKSKLLFIMKRNEGQEKIIEEIKKLQLDKTKERSLLELVTLDDQKEFWEEIENQYLNEHDEFVIYLQNTYPTLTSSNIKLLILIKLGLSNKEIAALRFVSTSSVKVAISRLYKKMNIDSTNIKMYNFLNSLVLGDQ